MKKLITIFLALAMIISLFPATFAAELTNPSKVKIVYSLANFINNEKMSTVNMKDRTYDTWYYYMNGNIDTTGKNVTVKTGGSKKRFNVSSHGGWAAFVINVPVAGEYEVYQDYFQATSGCVGGMHIIPFNRNYDSSSEIHSAITAGTFDTGASINYYNTTQTWITSTSALASKYFDKGEYLVVYTMKETPGGTANNSIFISTLTLNGGTDNVPMKAIVSTDDADINKDEKTQLTTTTYLSNATLSTTETVSYSSSDDNIATVDETGLVTGTGNGIATITATVTNSSYSVTVTDSIDINVTNPNLSGVKVEYDMKSPGVGTNIGDVTYAKTNGLWKYSYSSNGTNFKSVNANDCLSLEAHGGVGGYVAIAINVPAKGDYNLTFEHLKYISGTTKGAMYIAPASVALDDVVTGTRYLVTDKINYNEPDTSKIYINSIDLGPISFEKAGEYNVIYKALVDTATMYPGDIILNGGTGTAYVGTVTATDTEIKVGDIITPTVAVYNSSTGAAITSGVTLTSSDTAVAEIVDGTTVKAVGAGKATISATCTEPSVGNVIGTEIIVKAPAPVENAEYIAAFNPDSTGSETVNEFVTPLVYAKDGTKLDITPSATKAGNVWQVSTDAESGDYKFLYWAKGLSTGVKKRIVSRSASFNYDAENEGNYLIAVYEKENMKTSGDEYYNANGQLLENGNTLPYLTGYVGAATGWENRGDGMHVAIFPEENRATYTITVDGKEDTYHYGDPVVCTADAEKDGKKFFGWRKTVNNAPAELVSASTSYTFNAWENCVVTPVYETEKAVFNGVARKIVLGTFSVGSETAIMAEFIGFGDDVVERGISLNGTEIAMTTKEYNQFTIINNDNVANISGYAILADGTKVIYNK